MCAIKMFRILHFSFRRINFPRNACFIDFHVKKKKKKKWTISCIRNLEFFLGTTSWNALPFQLKGDLQRQGVCRVLHSVLHSRGSACCLPAKGRCLQERIRGPEVVGSTAPAITQTCMAIPISSSTRDRVGNQRVCVCVCVLTCTHTRHTSSPVFL